MHLQTKVRRDGNQSLPSMIGLHERGNVNLNCKQAMAYQDDSFPPTSKRPKQDPMNLLYAMLFGGKI